VLSGDDDDNGVTDYDDIPDYVLATNFVLMDPFGINQRNLTKFFAALTPHLDTYLAHLRTPEPPPGG
jgi:hypothetical protein